MMTTLITCCFGICMAVYMACGILLWTKRKEVQDRSRLYLSIFGIVVSISYLARIASMTNNQELKPYMELLPPFSVIGGLLAITLFLIYPIEVMRPRWLNGWRVLLPFLPIVVIAAPMLFGLRFQSLLSISDLWEHIAEPDVVLRLLGVVTLTCISLLLLIIPYNWRQSSADYHWVRRTTLMAQMISVLYFGLILTNLAVFQILHSLWCAFVIAYFTYNELRVRLVPVGVPESLGDGGDLSVVENKDLWQQVSYLMDIKEYWRNPDTTVASVSQTLGTNRIYVARCIKEHTGMTFNDYLNSKRVDFMANLLRQNPTQNQKQLFFAAGFRSYPTAHRNFVKFKGCSPTEYIEKLG